MAQVHDKIEKIFRSQNLSLRQAAIACGIKYTTFRSMLHNQREVPTSTLEAISRAFDVPFGYFSDRVPSIDISNPHRNSETTGAISDLASSAIQRVSFKSVEAGQQVTLESFLNWWVSNSGRLENFDQIAERVDLFEAPDGESNQIKPVKIGQSSLATKYFFLEETEHLKQTLDGFSPETNEALVKAHIDACNRGEPVISHPYLDEPLRGGQRFIKRYRRVMAPLYLPGGKMLLANYSEDIG